MRHGDPIVMQPGKIDGHWPKVMVSMGVTLGGSLAGTGDVQTVCSEVYMGRWPPPGVGLMLEGSNLRQIADSCGGYVHEFIVLYLTIPRNL